ncbi:MAG: hypothetical protein HeimC2_24250 [Candidatus Heimdallarchaeota archaeon LC_2]|nr:MAG: hypothetical protein HeimC2_24250 [Candidatus Heimdallarchaeota archaeon LC_2]
MDSNLQSLLGLSKNESKVYKAILENSSCDPNNLAQETGLPRTRIYEILTKLSAKNLLEKRNVGQGYQLIPPSESIDSILKNMESHFNFRQQAVKELGNHLQSVYSNAIGSELTPGVSILPFREAESIFLEHLKKVRNRVSIAVSADSQSIEWRKSGSILANSYTDGLDIRYMVSSPELSIRLSKALSTFPGFSKIKIQFGSNINLHTSFVILDDTIYLFFLGHKQATDLETMVLMTGSTGLLKSFEWMFNRLWETRIEV